MLEIVFDPEKNQKNIRERGLSFELVKELDWANTYEFVDDRFDYGEEW